MGHCECCGSYTRDYPCLDTLPLPLVPVSYDAEPFGNRNARAQKFRRATDNSPADAKWISELSQHSAHAVRMCESAPVVYALINTKMSKRQAADQLERARDVRTWLRRNDFPAAFIKLSYRSAALLGPYADTLSKVPATVLSQSIPSERQERWAEFIRDYFLNDGHRPRRGRVLQSRTNLPTQYILNRALDLLDVFSDARHFVDFLTDADVMFDERWGKNRLRQELAEWERTFALRKLEAERKRIEIIEGCPERQQLNGFEFIALNSKSALAAEGAAMRHCVGGSSYAWQVESKRCVIYAVQNQSERGTLQIAPSTSGMEIKQFKGPRNAGVSAAMMSAAAAFCKMVSASQNQRLAA